MGKKERIRSAVFYLFVDCGLIALVFIALVFSCGRTEDERPPYVPPSPSPATGLVSFARDVQPIFQANCAGGGCHSSAPFQDAAVAKAKFPEIKRRVNLPEGEAGHMPLGRPQLSANLRGVLAKWETDGFLSEEPQSRVTTTPPRLFGDAVNLEMLNYLLSKPAAVRGTTRCLAVSHLDDATQAKFLSGKVMNSLSRDRRLTLLEGGNGDNSGLQCFDLADIGLSVASWDAVAAKASAESVNFSTDVGRQVQVIARTQFPFLRADLFAEIALRDPLYRQLQPFYAGVQTQAQLEQGFGLNKAQEFARLTPLLSGFLGRPVSGVALNNRLVTGHKTQDGAYWETFDFRNGAANRVLTQFPLRQAFGGQSNFDHAGGELIFTLPSGLLGFGVVNNVGTFLNDVPPDVATNTLNAADAVVHNAISCFSCHASGLIKLPSDSVRDSVENNPNPGLSAFDRELALALYRDDKTMSQAVDGGRLEFAAAIKRLGGDVLGREPITEATEQFERQALSIKRLAWEVYLAPDKLSACIKTNALLSSQLGGLFDGGGVQREVIRQNFGLLAQVCRLGQEPFLPG